MDSLGVGQSITCESSIGDNVAEVGIEFENGQSWNPIDLLEERELVVFRGAEPPEAQPLDEKLPSTSRQSRSNPSNSIDIMLESTKILEEDADSEMAVKVPKKRRRRTKSPAPSDETYGVGAKETNSEMVQMPESKEAEPFDEASSYVSYNSKLKTVSTSHSEPMNSEKMRNYLSGSENRETRSTSSEPEESTEIGSETISMAHEEQCDKQKFSEGTDSIEVEFDMDPAHCLSLVVYQDPVTDVEMGQGYESQYQDPQFKIEVLTEPRVEDMNDKSSSQEDNPFGRSALSSKSKRPSRRRLTIGLLGLLCLGLFVGVLTSAITRTGKKETSQSKATETPPSVIKAAVIDSIDGSIIIQFTRLVEDPSVLFYYLNVEGLDFQDMENVTNSDHLALYLTNQPMPLLQDADKHSVFIPTLASQDFPYRLPDYFFPGEYEGLLIVESEIVLASGEFGYIEDARQNIVSDSRSGPTGTTEPTASPMVESPFGSSAPMATSGFGIVVPSSAPAGLLPVPSGFGVGVPPSAPAGLLPVPSVFGIGVPYVPSSAPSAFDSSSVGEEPFAETETRKPSQQPSKSQAPAPSAIPSKSPILLSEPPSASPSTNPTAFPDDQEVAGGGGGWAFWVFEDSTANPTSAPFFGSQHPSQPTSPPILESMKLSDHAQPEVLLPEDSAKSLNIFVHRLPVLVSALESDDYNIAGSITVDYAVSTEVIEGDSFTFPILRFNIFETVVDPEPYLYLSNRPYSETRKGWLSPDDILVHIDTSDDGSFTATGTFDQPFHEITDFRNLDDYADGSWLIWSLPLNIWLGGGSIASRDFMNQTINSVVEEGSRG
jgi:hypothetical protein